MKQSQPSYELITQNVQKQNCETIIHSFIYLDFNIFLIISFHLHSRILATYAAETLRRKIFLFSYLSLSLFFFLSSSFSIFFSSIPFVFQSSFFVLLSLFFFLNSFFSHPFFSIFLSLSLHLNPFVSIFHYKFCFLHPVFSTFLALSFFLGSSTYF